MSGNTFEAIQVYATFGCWPSRWKIGVWYWDSELNLNETPPTAQNTSALLKTRILWHFSPCLITPAIKTVKTARHIFITYKCTYHIVRTKSHLKMTFMTTSQSSLIWKCLNYVVKFELIHFDYSRSKTHSLENCTQLQMLRRNPSRRVISTFFLHRHLAREVNYLPVTGYAESR